MNKEEMEILSVDLAASAQRAVNSNTGRKTDKIPATTRQLSKLALYIEKGQTSLFGLFGNLKNPQLSNKQASKFIQHLDSGMAL